MGFIISILAPCIGSDILNCTEDLIHINFNSCSLRGERWMNLYFHVYTNLISIHAPRMESDGGRIFL